MRNLFLTISIACIMGLCFSTQAQNTNTTDNMKYYLMIAQPSDAAWKGVIEAGGDMAEPAGKAIEAMGGKLHSYYIGVNEAKNYGVVSFPSSLDIAKIVYLRTAQGVMKDIEFVEVLPSDMAVGIFEDVKSMLKD